MALSQTFTTSESKAGTNLYVDDETGDYSVTNLVGYGAPNTERTDLALFAINTAKKKAGDADIASIAYNPETVVQFEWSELSYEGWYVIDIYSVPRAGTEAVATNNFRYDFVGDALERYDGATWVAALTSELGTYKGTNNVTVVTKNHILIPSMRKAQNRLAKLRSIGSNQRNETDLERYMMEVEERVNGVLALFTNDDYITARNMVENYATRVTEINSLT